ncbi:MAG: biotin/lipoyl-binding protein [Myxococcales bacterium]|jgi:biotin carboxyl carrier protein|nr:biotin/lipoyl-binding protein [Myxococcales bacterium]MBL0197353.1 biotin/lipoyl-binding protein [Myxococcales bacterium]HQY62071.1 biotin/lipoyl-binding protein [Polyangiaceae bacterium]
MRYFVSFDPATPEAVTTVDIRELPSGALQVEIEGRRVEVDAEQVGPSLSIRVDGRVVDLTTEGAPPELGAIASGHRSYVRVESERQRAAARTKTSGGGGGDKTLKAPMPGRVVRVLAKPGDAVIAGQPLLVLEAMKMENEVKARADGTVLTVHVTEGATVESNARLLTLA